MKRAFILAAMSLVACDAPIADCYAGADCASGACRSDGTCAPLAQEEDDGGVATSSGAGGAGGNDGTSSAGGGTSGTGAAPPSCQANDDGLIERAEVPLDAGLSASFAIAEDVPVDIAGWNLAEPIDGEVTDTLEHAAVAGTWFADIFPNATYAGKIPGVPDLLGVFEATDGALLMLGVVSPEDGVLRTELTYDPPIELYRFPLAEGEAWSTTSTVAGLSHGIASYYTEEYDVSVDAVGQMVTPLDSFAAHRVRVDLTRTVGLLVTTVRSFLFVSECAGTVATIVSHEHEQSVEFANAAEVQRVAP